MTPFLPPFACEERPRPHGVSSFKLPNESILAFDPRIMQTHLALYEAFFREVFDAWAAREFAPKPGRKAA